MMTWLHFKFLPPTNEVWGKVLFLHMSVILFTGGGGVGFPACITDHMTRGSTFGGRVCIKGGGVSLQGGLPTGRGLGRPPTGNGKMGGTHPTGMLSCVWCGYGWYSDDNSARRDLKIWTLRSSLLKTICGLLHLYDRYWYRWISLTLLFHSNINTPQGDFSNMKRGFIDFHCITISHIFKLCKKIYLHSWMNQWKNWKNRDGFKS